MPYLGLKLTPDAWLYRIASSPSTYTISYLVVAGGGGAGGYTTNGVSGGGGAGGLLTSSLTWASGITFVATIGAGGSLGGTDGTIDFKGTNGGNSSLVYGTTAIIASGGGGGGTYDIQTGSNGGSGGGGGGGGITSGFGGNGVNGQGFNGGNGRNTGDSGGGGGAGGVGGNAYNDAMDNYYSGNGGDGLSYSITGYSDVYACGGAGVGGNNNGSLPTGFGSYGCGGSVATGGFGAGGGYGGAVILSVPTSKYTGIITGSPSVNPDGSGNTIIVWDGTSGTYIS